MKSREVAWPMKRGDMPDYEEEDALAYDADQLRLLFTAADAEERVLFEFFLHSGCRE